MPRIAVAVAVVAIIGMSIGINIVRFPVVWEMVGTSGSRAASTQSLPSPEPISSEPPINLAEMAPPETLGGGRSDTAPLRVIRDESDVSSGLKELRGSEPEALKAVDTAWEGGVSKHPEGSLESEALKASDAAAPETQLISTRTAESSEPAQGGLDGAKAGLSQETRTDSPAQGPSGGPASPGNAAASANRVAAGDRLALDRQTQWPAEVAPSIRYAARPATATVKPAPRWRSSKPLVPIDWSPDATEKSPARILIATDGRRRVERLPPVDDVAPIAMEREDRRPDAPVPLSATRP